MRMAEENHNNEGQVLSSNNNSNNCNDASELRENQNAIDVTTGPSSKEWDLAKARKNFWCSYVICIGLSVLVCFVLTHATSWWTINSRPIPANPYSIAMVGHILFTAFICSWSAYYNNSAFYDAYWSVAPMIFSIYWTAAAGDFFENNIPRIILLVLAIWIWGIRLTRNWYISWPGMYHEDWRILDIKRKFLLEKKSPVVLYWFVGVFLASMGIQTILVGIASYPIYVATLSSSATDFNWIDVLSFLVCISGAFISYIADEQMRYWQKNIKSSLPNPSTAIMMTGLWNYSRHPNYFGEICFWWGCYGFSIAVDASPWCAIGAILITCLFVFATIPLMEDRSKIRRPNYETQCMATTSMLIPLPRRCCRKRD